MSRVVGSSRASALHWCSVLERIFSTTRPLRPGHLAGARVGLQKYPQLSLPPTPWGPLQRQQRGPSWPPGLAALGPSAYLPGVPKVRGVTLSLATLGPAAYLPGVPKVRVSHCHWPLLDLLLIYQV
jgi:hypothetical protein